MYKAGDKFVIEIDKPTGNDATVFKITGSYNAFAVGFLDKLDRLDGDYVNEHFGELQDEAYEEGKKAGIDETIKYYSGVEDQSFTEGFNAAISLIDSLLAIKTTTGKSMDIGLIVEELRKE